MKSNCRFLLFISFLSIRVRMSWNFGDNSNLIRQLKSNLGLHLVVLTLSKTSLETLKLTEVETQQLPDIGETGFKEEISCLKWTLYNVRRKVCVKFKPDTDK